MGYQCKVDLDDIESTSKKSKKACLEKASEEFNVNSYSMTHDLIKKRLLKKGSWLSESIIKAYISCVSNKTYIVPSRTSYSILVNSVVDTLNGVDFSKYDCLVGLVVLNGSRKGSDSIDLPPLPSGTSRIGQSPTI